MRLRAALMLLCLWAIQGCSQSSDEHLQDADTVRLKHLQHYAELIEGYHARTGKYPFEGAFDAPTYVYVANDEQIKYTQPGPGYAHESIPFARFVSTLSDALERDIDEMYDPLDVPDTKPNFYVYLISGDTYYFAVHVRHPYAFAKPLGEHYYKIEISNRPNEKNKAQDPVTLFAEEGFVSAVNAPISNTGYFKRRQAKYLTHTSTQRD